MSDTKLPGLNYNTPLGITDFSVLEDVYTDQFLTRMRLLSGGAGVYDTITGHGIVDESDPETTGTGSSDPSRPLQVRRVSALVNDKVVVKPGIAVSPSGHVIVILPPDIGDHTLDLTVGDTSVVYVEYTVADDPNTVVVTRYNTSAAKRQMVTSEVKVALLSDYNDPTIFPPDRLRNVVVLAVCTVTAGASTLSIDQSRANYTFNRPWFSAVDIVHRNLKGTGLATTPHSLGLNDLSAGAMTLYQQLTRHGVVIGKDRLVPGIPGHLCTETIPAVAILTDDVSGSVTGFPSSRYAKLSQFITRVVAAYGITTNYPVAVTFLENTNIVIVDSAEIDAIANGFVVCGTAVNAGQPAIQILQNDELVIQQPLTGDELVVSGGKAMNELSVLTAKFGTSAPIPYFYNVFLTADGQPLINPQCIKCPVTVTTLGSAIQPFDNASYAPGKVMVGIAQGSSNPAWMLEVKIYGKDVDGISINETLTWTGTGYTPPTIPSNTVDLTPFRTTTQVFYTISNIQVSNSANLTGNEILTAYAMFDHVNTPGFADLCPVARVLWNGQAAAKIIDTRKITTHLGNMPSNKMDAWPMQASFLNALAYNVVKPSTINGFACVAMEDFRSPRFVDYRFTSDYFFNDGLEGGGLGVPNIDSVRQYTSRAIKIPSTAGTDNRLILFVFRSNTNWAIGNNNTVAVTGVRYATASPTAGSAMTFVPVVSYGGMYDMYQVATSLTNQLKVTLTLKGNITGYALFFVDGV